MAFVPEGDTIYRAAAALRTALVGQKLVRFDAPRLVGPAPVAGRTIETVRSHGKHLEIIFDDGIVLHSHMRMTGSWHLYHAGERWRRPHRQMRAIIDTADWQAVCFNAPVLETYRVPDRRRHPGMGNLGPDLCSTNTDLHRCVDLLLSYPEPEETIAEVMLDQRVMCGVGNVYRSEVLWACELSPWAPVGTLSEAQAEMVVNTAARLLPRQPAVHGADHDGQREGWPRRVRPHDADVRAVPRHDRVDAARRVRPRRVLVSRVPAPPRPAGRGGAGAGDGSTSGRSAVPPRPSVASGAVPPVQPARG